ncbi:LEAF RUST 10 DISEASE-RESISTANCE LOCUS RECEPTOR-LIKE PROTEIN KINASE-like 1.2 isoform X1 [Rhodamnia argentea]|uniref:non-specific serine/threonine protein kinase n=1 Tax=Rhodamnia argentea TaxID=178133 RepID=A0A8B8QAP0_9MYRT|nr:LEAF RUST 10 DISEASE-RESISTANCE LOCUS RECEPTOR-LIKE PROTEIN KINASE-like 1.2 isoform X1 [Rhodamnia argentea]
MTSPSSTNLHHPHQSAMTRARSRAAVAPPLSPLQMHANLSLLFLFSLSLSLQESLSHIDPHFGNCSLPVACGGLKISFPFYVLDRQPSYCGFPGFNLSCAHDRLVITLSGDDYVVRDVFYRSQSLRVSNAALSDDNSTASSYCAPGSLKNLTLPSAQFQLGQNVTATLSLLYNCNLSPRADELLNFRISCSGEGEGGERGVVLGIYGDGEDQEVIDATKKCGTLVEAPVAAEWREGAEIGEALRSGFVLNWKASSCSACERSGGKCGFDHESYHFQCYCPDRPHAAVCRTGNNYAALKIGVGSGVGALASIFLCSCIYMIHYKRRHPFLKLRSRQASSGSSLKADIEVGNVLFEVPIFTNGELEEATNYFDSARELGDGGYGTVYHGKLRDGREVAVKRLYEHNYRRVKQFMTEVQILTRLRHKYLVSLYGCTSQHSRELLLVYEYIPNGTVADHLHGKRAQQDPLLWPTRISIAIETATALAYLHASDIIHRDVKTNNILLDNNFSVKVADFGLSRLFPNDVSHVSTAPQGTPGYVDPEYHQCYQLTEKSDVYSFGVVLVELISSMPAVDISRDRHEINLANLATSKIQKHAFHELIDPNLGFESDPEINRMIMAVAELAFRCLQQDKDMRPSMETVLEELKAISSGTQEPDKSKDVSDDNSIGQSKNPPPSPESEGAGLLKNVKPSASPVSVTQKWGSSGSSTVQSG